MIEFKICSAAYIIFGIIWKFDVNVQTERVVSMFKRLIWMSQLKTYSDLLN